MTYPGEVDWSDLVHAYGTATDTPGHLAALTSLDPSAFDHLWGAVLHQGTIYPATAPAVAWIVDHLDAPELTGQTRGLLTGTEVDGRTMLLQFLGAVGESATWASEEELHAKATVPVDPADLARARSYDDGPVSDDVWDVVLARGVLAVRALAPTVMAALRPYVDDPDPQRRAAARAALTRWGVLTDPDQVAVLHGETARTAPDLPDRVAAVLGLRTLGHDTSEFLSAEEPAMRTAAALGAADPTDPRVADVLLTHLEALPWSDEDLREAGEDFFEGHPRFTVVEALTGLDLEPGRLVAPGRVVIGLSSGYVFDRDVGPLLCLALRGWAGGSLTPPQSELLRAVADSDEIWEPAILSRTRALERLGLPTDRDSLATLLDDRARGG